jgi:hypothetical protein
MPCLSWGRRWLVGIITNPPFDSLLAELTSLPPERWDLIRLAMALPESGLGAQSTSTVNWTFSGMNMALAPCAEDVLYHLLPEDPHLHNT